MQKNGRGGRGGKGGQEDYSWIAIEMARDHHAAMGAVKDEEDKAFYSAINVAEEVHGALRALKWLVADQQEKQGKGGSMTTVARNDFALLLGIVGDRLGDALAQSVAAREAGREGGNVAAIR